MALCVHGHSFHVWPSGATNQNVYLKQILNSVNQHIFFNQWYKFQKNLPHFSQMYFFSSGVIWLIIWYSNLTLEGNNFSQCGHGSSCEWTLSLWEANPIVPLKNGGKNIFSIYIIFFPNKCQSNSFQCK